MIDMPMLEKALAQIKSQEAVLTRTQWDIDSDILIESEAKWTQSTWRSIELDIEDHRCKTGMCLAGWVAELDPEVTWKVDAFDRYRAGVAVKAAREASIAVNKLYVGADRRSPAFTAIQELSDRMHETLTTAKMIVNDMDRAMDTVLAQGKSVQVERWAIDRLGLSDNQAAELFAASNTIERIESLMQAMEDDPDFLSKPKLEADESDCEPVDYDMAE